VWCALVSRCGIVILLGLGTSAEANRQADTGDQCCAVDEVRDVLRSARQIEPTVENGQEIDRDENAADVVPTGADRGGAQEGSGEFGSALPDWATCRMPPAPQIAPPTTNVVPIISFVRMPTSRAAERLEPSA